MAFVYRRIILRTTAQFTAEAGAHEIVAGTVLEINSGDPRLATPPLTMCQLIEHHRRRELAADSDRKAVAPPKREAQSAVVKLLLAA